MGEFCVTEIEETLMWEVLFALLTFKNQISYIEA